MGFDRTEHCRRIASRGGRATVRRHGAAHMRKIGRRGFEATTRRHFAGSRAAHLSWLKERGLYGYWESSGLAMKRDRDGNGVWPERAPVHPARGGVMF